MSHFEFEKAVSQFYLLQVSWFTSSYIIITTGRAVVTNDIRININTSNPGEWNLMIKDVLPSDEDEYKCMLQTFPPQTKNVQLIVLGKYICLSIWHIVLDFIHSVVSYNAMYVHVIFT